VLQFWCQSDSLLKTIRWQLDDFVCCRYHVHMYTEWVSSNLNHNTCYARPQRQNFWRICQAQKNTSQESLYLNETKYVNTVLNTFTNKRCNFGANQKCQMVASWDQKLQMIWGCFRSFALHRIRVLPDLMMDTHIDVLQLAGIACSFGPPEFTFVTWVLSTSSWCLLLNFF
jgi:hypothetical protein